MLGRIFVLVFGAGVTAIVAVPLLRDGKNHARRNYYLLPLGIGLTITSISLGALLQPSLTGHVIGQGGMVLIGLGLLYAAARPSSRLFAFVDWSTWAGSQSTKRLAATASGVIWIGMAIYLWTLR